MALSIETCLDKLASALCVTAVLMSGCADRQQPPNETISQPEATTAGTRGQQAGPEPGLVAENVLAPMDSPWRNAGIWQEMHTFISFSPDNPWDWAPQRYQLAQLARQLPDRLERAEVHLRLARIGPNHSLWARQNVLQSQQLLAELIARVPSSPGLLKAVVDANRSYHWYHINGDTEFYERARGFLEERWRDGRGDAAEAGYRLSQILATTNQSAELEAEYGARLGLLDEVISRFPGTNWALQAEFDRIGLQEQLQSYTSNEARGDAHLQKYVAFADKHPGHPLAARALLLAAQSYGFGEYGQAQHSGLPNVPRLERAMELHIRYHREYPEGAPRNPNVRRTQPEPSIQVWGKPDPAADTARLEQLAEEYYALNPRGATTLITTLGALKEHGAGPLPLAARRAFYQRFWDQVEELARPAALPAVRLARAWFLTEGEPYSTPKSRGQQLQEASAILERVCEDFPRSDAAAVALDALALLAIRQEQPQQALAYWEELEAEFPGHPLNRPAAVDRLFLEHPTQDGALWRLAVKELQQQFPDDPLIAVCTRCVRARSLLHDRGIAAARREFEEALDPWTSVFPWDRIHIASQTVALGPLHEVQAGLFRQAGLVAEESPLEDLRFLSRQSLQTPEERIAAYTEVLELFPESPHSMNHRVFLAHALLDSGRLDDARQTFQRVADEKGCEPDTRLLARLIAIRLGFQLADSPSAKDSAGDLLAAVQEYSRTVTIVQPQDPRGADVADLYRHAYANCTDWPGLLETLVSRNAANKWYAVTGSDSMEVEFHDGLLLNYVMSPPLPTAIAGRAIRLADPASFLNALGVGDPQAAKFIETVVGRVFVMDTEENRKLSEPADQQLSSPPENNAAPLRAGPLIVRQHPKFVRFVFYDDQRSRAEVHVNPRTDVSEVLFYARRDGSWESSNAHGWFRWGR